MEDHRKTVIKVVGLGGGGSNAVNRMIELGIDGIEFIAANTDAQALAQSLAPVRLQLGPQLTRGLGAGGDPEMGEAAAKESRDEIKEVLNGADLVFLAAGMGGGTGTGAIPVAAEVARATGALTIAIVTTPFLFEGNQRPKNAEAGLARLRPNVDTLINVPNERLLQLLGKNMKFEFALRVADEVLRQGVQGIAELVSKAGLINVDFAHIRSLMECAGGAMMAIGNGKGDHKAVEAVRQALRMPLLDIRSIDAACGVLVHFTGGEDLGLHEISQAAEEVNRAAPHADVIFGATLDPMFKGRAQVILIATGMASQPLKAMASAASERLIQRPAPAKHSPAPTPPPGSPPGLARGRAEGGPEAAPVHLADALFNGAAASTGDPLAQPWVVAEAPAAKTHNLDVPAFLRRRRSLRDFEGRQ